MRKREKLRERESERERLRVREREREREREEAIIHWVVFYLSIVLNNHSHLKLKFKCVKHKIQIQTEAHKTEILYGLESRLMSQIFDCYDLDLGRVFAPD